MMIFRAGDEMREIRLENADISVRNRSRTAIPPSRKQYCCQESDKRIRERIRAMDDRERMIVLDELGKIYEERKKQCLMN